MKNFLTQRRNGATAHSKNNFGGAREICGLKRQKCRAPFATVLVGVLALNFFTLAVRADGTNDQDAVEYRNWVTLGGGGSFLSGDAGAFQQHSQLPRDGYGGIESLHYETDLTKKTLLELDGHGLYDSHNYGIGMKLSNPDTGYIKAGFEQFRNWYDGSGGYFPGGTNHWKELYNPLALDRGHAWFEAGLRKESFPEITLRYDHEYREGFKSSTIWGDASVVGTPLVYPNPTATSPTLRGFVPTLLDINEKRDAVAIDAKQSFGETDFSVGLRYERIENDNARDMRRRPGETNGPNAPTRADRYLTEREKLTEDLFNAHAVSETRFSDKTKLTVGGAFTTFDTGIGGSRIFGNGFDSAVGPYLRSQSRDSGFFALSGGSQTRDYVGNVNLMFTPFEKFVVVPSIRFESEEMDGNALFLPTTVNAAGGPVVTNAITKNITARNSLEVTEAIETRYTGFTNFSLYARAEISQTTGDDLYQIFTNRITQLNESENWRRDWQKYSAGANWYPLARLNFGAQYYYKASDYSYNLKAATHDVNFRAHWRPLNTVSLMGRYDFQVANFRGDNDAQTGEVTAHILSGTINWTPVNRLYIQLGSSYSFENTFSTPASTAAGITNVVPSLDSGYLTANATVGYALDEKTDLTLGYAFYKADDYVNNSRWSQPFGAADESHTVTATIARQITKQLRGTVQYAYAQYRDNASGGFNNYDAHMIYASMQYRF